jgi:hypothetical protein
MNKQDILMRAIQKLATETQASLEYAEAFVKWLDRDLETFYRFKAQEEKAG